MIEWQIFFYTYIVIGFVIGYILFLIMMPTEDQVHKFQKDYPDVWEVVEKDVEKLWDIVNNIPSIAYILIMLIIIGWPYFVVIVLSGEK